MIKWIKNFTAVTAAIFFSISCENNPLKVDISKIKLETKIIRFDKELNEARIKGIENNLPALISKYPDFFELYSNHIITIGSVYNKDFSNKLNDFFEYEMYEEVNTKISKIFTDTYITKLNNQINTAFKYYLYYYPKSEIPNIYSFNGGFNQSIVIGDKILGIGLDKYLGKDYEGYKRLGFDNYKIQRMYKEQVLSDVIYAFIESEFPNNFTEDNLISEMLYQGRIMYMLDALLPEETDSLKWNFSNKQLKWLEQSERDMWDYLIDQKILFNSDYMLKKRFTGEGPFTSEFGKESPAKAAVWIGYRIINSYQKMNETSIPELMKISDSQKILNKAKYNP